MTSHELRGLNVIVRLVKRLKGVDWLHLLRSDDKVNWLKYNYDAIVDVDGKSFNFFIFLGHSISE
jgi:hypothetical protein